VYLPETIPAFIERLVAIAEGHRTFEAEIPVQTLCGDRREVFVSLALPEPGTPFDRVLVSKMDITALKEAERALLETERAKREAARSAADSERRRLARELHDGALQDLGAIKLTLEAERRRGTDATLGSVLDRIGSVIHEVRAVVENLQPGDLHKASLQEAIAAHARRLTHPAGIALMLELDDHVRIAPTGVRDLYRIAQEALANAVRHGNPRRIAVRLRQRMRDTLLEIDDDGRGFNAAVPSAGIGLASMRERAAALGGDLDIASTAGRGTRVRVVIPSATAEPAVVLSPAAVSGS
jgi:signal transduction histidine kinase